MRLRIIKAARYFLKKNSSISLSIQPTRKDQAASLIELLLRKDNCAFISFYNALVKEAYDDLARLLYDNLPQISSNGYEKLSDENTSYGEEVETIVWTVTSVGVKM